MIITILSSSANFHAIAYNEMKVEKGVATLLEAQNILGLRLVKSEQAHPLGDGKNPFTGGQK